MTPITNLNMDRSLRVVLAAEDVPWRWSPGRQVQRKMLERESAESGWATSVVRYPPGSAFPRHTHGGGEEFFVLDGVFSDEMGDHGPGTYVRNPIGSSHAPRSDDGCTIFVKLCQMRATETARTCLDTDTVNWESVGPGIARRLLFEDSTELVELLRLTDNEAVEAAGRELVVIDGILVAGDQTLKRYSWLRVPAADILEMRSEHAVLWSKRACA